MFTAWNDLSALEQAAVIYSDMHKDAYGFRPREGGVHRPVTLADYQAAFTSMQDTIAADEAREAEQAAAAIVKVEAEIAALASDHGLDRATALRWWFEAEGYTEADYGNGSAPDPQGAEMILWERGVAFFQMDALVGELIPRKAA